MLYPDKLMRVEENLSLYIPDPELIKSVYENLKNRNEKTLFPFWAQIWPSAKAMASFLLEHPHLVYKKRVLEIGAGIGLPSFCITDHAAELIISDYAQEAVLLIEKNIHFLSLKNAKAICLNWNDLPDTVSAEVLLLSDINYAPGEFQVLLTVIQRFLNNHTTILLSTPQRITITPFAEALQPFIKESFLQTVEHLGQLVEIRMLVLSK